jgi:hypothetical protein
LSESGPEAVKTLGIAAGNNLFVPNHCSALHARSTLLLLCVASLAAIGCGNTDPGLEDTARNISRRSSARLTDVSMAGAAAPEEDVSASTEVEEEDVDLAEDDDMADEGAEDAPEAPMADAGMDTGPGSAGLISDDSSRCGNGMLDQGEFCDIAIKEGAGSCPTECEQPDACHAGKLEVRSCWTQCVVGELVDC